MGKECTCIWLERKMQRGGIFGSISFIYSLISLYVHLFIHLFIYFYKVQNKIPVVQVISSEEMLTGAVRQAGRV